jgi:hypothetical protein
MKKKLEALIEVRKIIAFLVTGVFVYMAVKNKLDIEFVKNVVLMVIAFYFAKSTALDKQEK